MMPSNIQKDQRLYTIPTGWSTPEFIFGQFVLWKLPATTKLKTIVAWGQIVEMSFAGGTWLYGSNISPNCPLALAYPDTFGEQGIVEWFRADKLTLIANETNSALASLQTQK
jgi:hypothetical protein